MSFPRVLVIVLVLGLIGATVLAQRAELRIRRVPTPDALPSGIAIPLGQGLLHRVQGPEDRAPDPRA